MLKFFIIPFVLCTLVWARHRIKYSKTNYQRFEYYLLGETNPSVTEVVMLYETVMAKVLIVGALLLGGLLIGKVFNI